MSDDKKPNEMKFGGGAYKGKKRPLSHTINYRTLLPKVPVSIVDIETPVHLKEDILDEEIPTIIFKMYRGCFFLLSKHKAGRRLPEHTKRLDDQIILYTRNCIGRKISPQVMLFQDMKYHLKNKHKHPELRSSYYIPSIDKLVNTKSFSHDFLVKNLRRAYTVKHVYNNPKAKALHALNNATEHLVRHKNLNNLEEIKNAIAETHNFEKWDSLIKEFHDTDKRRAALVIEAQKYYIPLWGNPTFVEYLEKLRENKKNVK